MMKVLAVLALCIAVISAHSIGIKQYAKISRAVSGRIIGGTPANAGEFPFAAAIYYRTPSGTYFCGGSLISNQWILTGGNCVNNAVAFTIHLGSIKLDGVDSLVVATSDFVTHPNYDPNTYANDIGLIKLRAPIELTDYIQPMYLPTVDVSTNITNIYALGWGSTSDQESGLSDVLNYVKVSALSTPECQSVYGNLITDNMVCVEGNFNEGACRGDLGGPLATILNHHAWHLGVSTFISSEGCETTQPSGYTKTYPYVDWIKTTTGVGQ